MEVQRGEGGGDTGTNPFFFVCKKIFDLFLFWGRSDSGRLAPQDPPKTMHGRFW